MKKCKQREVKLIKWVVYAKCTCCWQRKQLNEENFYKNWWIKTFGFLPNCITCFKKIQNQRNQEKREQFKAEKEITKVRDWKLANQKLWYELKQANQRIDQDYEKKYWKITKRLNKWIRNENFWRCWNARLWDDWTRFTKYDLINKRFVTFLVINNVLDYKNADFVRWYVNFIDCDFETYSLEHSKENIVLMIIATQDDPLWMLNNMIKD